MVPAHTTPLPNIYLDELLPRLSASELKLLLVITRQTLGWLQKDGSRKPQDWMTGQQLQRRTGNSHTSVSAAIESLVCKGLIEVRDEMGITLSTPAQRRRCSKLYFSRKLSENFKLPTPGINVKAPFQKVETTKEQKLNNIHHPFVVAKNRKGENKVSSSSIEGISQHGVTGELSALRELSASISPDKPRTEPTPEALSPEMLSPQAKAVLHSYREHFKENFPCLAPPLALRSDLELLEGYLKNYKPEILIGLLPCFFQLDYGFNARRKYSLHSFLHSVNVLRFGSIKNLGSNKSFSSSRFMANFNEIGKRGPIQSSRKLAA